MPLKNDWKIIFLKAKLCAGQKIFPSNIKCNLYMILPWIIYENMPVLCKIVLPCQDIKHQGFNSSLQNLRADFFRSKSTTLLIMIKNHFT